MEKIIASITKEIKGKLKEVYPYTKTKAITNNEDVCLDDILDNKVDKVDGGGLSTNDFTNQYKEKLDNLNINLDNKVDKIEGKSLISDTEIERLSTITNYDDTEINNTLDTKVDKVIGKSLISDTEIERLSTITNYDDTEIKNSLTNKVDKVEGKSLISDTEIERLSTITNYDDTEIKNSLDTKVDKVIGKGLSTNDLTNELKESYDNTVKNSHTHENKTIIDKLGEDSNGKLLYDGSTISADANITIDSELSSTSTNPVQNKVINNAITNKVDKIEGKSLISDTEIERLSTITNYDDTEIKNSLDTKVDKVIGKGLSTNDLTNELKESYDNTVNNSHTHENKSVVDMFSEDSNGKLLYNGSTISADVNITIDSTLSSTSENPVQNKVITSKIDSINECITNIDNQIFFNGTSDKLFIDKPVVCIIADDGLKTTDGTALTTWLEDRYIPECFAIITGNVGKSGSYTLDELNTFKNKGHEILCHSITVDSLDSLSADNRYYALNTGKQFMTTNGFNDKIFVYPSGNNSSEKEAYMNLVSKYFKYGLAGNIASESSNINKGQWNNSIFTTSKKRFDIARCLITSQTSLSVSWYKTMIDNCVSANGFILLSCHDYGTDFSGGGFDNMKAIIEYLRDRGCLFTTASNALQIIEKQSLQMMVNRMDQVPTLDIHEAQALSHSHTNKTIIDKLGEDSNGKLLYNGSTISADANITIDSELSNTSENPVQNKVINNTLNTKVDKVIGKSLISDTEIERLSTITNYDDTEINNSLTNKVDKVIGKGLSTNDLTNELKESYDNTVTIAHTHTNKEIVDMFSEDSDGKLLYNSEPIKSENSDIQVNFTESTNFKKNSNPAVEFNIDSSLPSKNELNVSYNYTKAYSYSGFGPKEEADASISDITFKESGYDKFFTKQSNNKFLVIAPFTASIQCGVIQSPMDSNYAKGSFFINDVKVAEYSGRHLYPGGYKTLTHDFVAGDTFFCYTNDNNDNPQQYCIFTIPQDEKISTTTHNHINKDMIDKLSYDTTSNRLKYNDINIIAEVDVSAENNNAVVKKSDGLYVTDKSIDIDNINTKINILSTIKNVDYSKPMYCYLYTNIAVTTSIYTGYIIPFDIVGENNGFELNSTNHSVKLIAGIPYKISCDIPIAGGAGYANISIYNLTLDIYLNNFSKIASNFNGTTSDSSASIIYTPDVDSEIQIKVVSSNTASLNTSSYHGHLIVEEIGMYSFINPVKYIDSTEGLEDTPIGTVISYMGKTVPKHYLACDGATYNITDYPYLSQFIEDEFGSISYFGGDGITTFSVPNLQGEFLRGTGTNFSTGADVGLHQDASGVQNFYTDSGTTIGVLANSGSGYSNDNYDSIIETATRAVTLAGTTSTAYNGQVQEYTTRPSNTSVLYCIKYEPTYYMQVTTSTDYKVLWEGSASNAETIITFSEDISSFDVIQLSGIWNTTPTTIGCWASVYLPVDVAINDYPSGILCHTSATVYFWLLVTGTTMTIKSVADGNPVIEKVVGIQYNKL